MIHQRWYECGKIFGMRYVFDERGEGLAMHRHPPAHEHTVIVLKGVIQIRGVNEADGSISGGILVQAPCLVDILPEQHELVAVEPGTELLNLYKNGKPSEYEGLPESEKDITVASERFSIDGYS